jgi:hypothetical protein
LNYLQCQFSWSHGAKKEFIMIEIKEKELALVSGGFWIPILRFIAPVIINSIIYSVNKHRHDEEITATGVAIAAGTGVISGGLGAATGIATGGTIAGAVAWTPGTMAINTAGNMIAEGY